MVPKILKNDLFVPKLKISIMSGTQSKKIPSQFSFIYIYPTTKSGLVVAHWIRLDVSGQQLTTVLRVESSYKKE